MFWAFRRCFFYELRSIGSKFVCLNGLDTEVAKALACKVASFGYGSVTKETRGKVVVGYFAVDRGLFCHDQVSSGKFLAFFNL